jgi:hypothetical protein
MDGALAEMNISIGSAKKVFMGRPEIRVRWTADGTVNHEHRGKIPPALVKPSDRMRTMSAQSRQSHRLPCTQPAQNSPNIAVPRQQANAGLGMTGIALKLPLSSRPFL